MKDELFLALLSTQGAHWNRSRMGFQELGLSDGQPKVLYILRDVEGCVQKELAEKCQIKPSSMAVMLDRLQQQGYVRREEVKVSGGKRAFRIFLTEEGRVMAEKVHELMEEIDRECFRDISEEERKVLLNLLHRVKNNLWEATEKHGSQGRRF